MAITENQPGLLWLKDTEGRLLVVNKTFAQACGRTDPGEVQGLTDFDLWPRELAQKYREDDLRVMQSGQSIMEEEAICVNGRNIWHETFKTPVRDEQGLVIGTTGYARDITERKQAQLHDQWRNRILEALATGASLNAILELLALSVEAEEPEALCTVLLLDEEGKHLVHGAGPSMPEFFNQAIHGAAIGPAVGSCGTATFTGKRVVVEDITTHHYWVDYRGLAEKAGLRSCWAEPIFSAKGQVLGSFAIYHREPRFPSRAQVKLIKYAADLASIVIERKQAEQALQISEERLHLATMAGNIGVWDWDIVNNELVYDISMYSLYGIHKEDFGGAYEAWITTLHPEDRAFAEAKIQAALRGEEEYAAEFRIVRPDGEVRMIKAESQTIRDPDGKPVRMIGINLDITESKQAQTLLLQAKEAAETANLAKDQFIAMLSHELRTPLTPVLATVTGLQAQTTLPLPLQADLEIIRRNVEMEAALIDDLLDATRISRGRLVLHPEAVDIHACLGMTLGICQKEIAPKRLELRLEFHAERHHVWADPVRLGQAFWNLLKNAVKFTPKGGRIILRTFNIGEQLQIAISDTGIGIEPDVLPRIFNPFEQAERGKTRQFGGLGLGLHIARAVVELHQGRLTAASEGKNKGATFTVELATIVPPDKPVSPPHAEEAQEQALDILLVEDHPDTMHCLAKMITKWGHTVTAANTVEKARKLAAGQKFDLLISDLGLPDGSGLDVMREVKERSGIPGIALSGYGTEEDIRQSQAAGFATHLVKPINIAALHTAIREFAPSSSR